MRDTAAAQKYAEALFAEAKAHQQLLACQQGLQEIARVVRLRASLSQILSHPFIPVADKKSMIHTALGEYATPLLERFLALLVTKRRFGLLSPIVQAFQELVDRSENIQALRVRTAFAFTETQRKRLQENLETWLHAKVRMDIQVDPQLIGGLVIQTRDQELDQSVRTQLRRMYSKILAA